MPPLHREHNVYGPFKHEKGRLSFRTGSALLAQEALRAKKAELDFTVCLINADPISDFTGRIENVELITVAKPAQWQIVMSERREERGR